VADHGAAEAALRVFDHQAAFGRHRRHLALSGTPIPPSSRPSGQHVSTVLPAPHGYLLRSHPSAGSRVWPYLRASVAEEVPAGPPPARRVGSGPQVRGGGAPACLGKGRGFAGAEPPRVGLPSFCGPYPERHYREPGVGVAWCPFASLSRAGNLLDAI